MPEKNVFINCPLDDDYWSLLRPLIFTISFIGYNPQLAPQFSDSAQFRLEKIINLISNSDSGIHDLSRIKSESIGEFARMNMPFELGIEIGYKNFTERGKISKHILVLEKSRYDYQKALSDLSGCDIKNHDNDPMKLIRKVREWFVETKKIHDISGPTQIWNRFNDFMYSFHINCGEKGFSEEDIGQISTCEFTDFVKKWVKDNAH
jgi:hypothetical protein